MKKLILLLLPLSVFAQKKALFLGNSYTFYNQMPDIVVNIAQSLGDTLIVDSNTPGGAKLQDHAQTGSVSLQKIQQEQWDAVIIQAQSQEPSFPPLQVQEDTYPYAELLVDAVRDNHSCSDPIFFMTWGRKNGDNVNGPFYPIISTYEGMQQRLRESYLEMGNDNEAMVSPVGMAWYQIVQQYPEIELYTADESHPNIYGSYLAACVFYSMLFEKSCENPLTFVSNGISQEDATTIQSIASNTVLDSTELWNMFYVQSVDTNQLNQTTFEFDVEATHYDSLNWYFEPGQNDQQANTSHTFSQQGDYEVVLTLYANGGCKEKVFSYDISVDSTSNDSTIAIFMPVHDGKLVKVYPIPANSYIDIEGTETGSTVMLYDIQGRLMFSQVVNGNKKERLELGNLSKGTYILEIANKENTNTFKVIKY